VSKVAQSADLGMFERKGKPKFQNVILRCAMVCKEKKEREKSFGGGKILTKEIVKFR
jgi:hypothetical protein